HLLASGALFSKGLAGGRELYRAVRKHNSLTRSNHTRNIQPGLRNGYTDSNIAVCGKPNVFNQSVRKEITAAYRQAPAPADQLPAHTIVGKDCSHSRSTGFNDGYVAVITQLRASGFSLSAAKGCSI